MSFSSIAGRAGDGDIVVTADVPLAGRCVGAGALVTGPSGRVFDKSNIGMATAMRDLGAHLRETGESKGYNPSFSQRDRCRIQGQIQALASSSVVVSISSVR